MLRRCFVDLFWTIRRRLIPYHYWMVHGPVLDAIPRLAEAHRWDGTATELLPVLARLVPRRLLPSSPSALSRELLGWADVLEDLGVRVTFTRRVDERVIHLEAVPVEPCTDCSCPGEVVTFRGA